MKTVKREFDPAVIDRLSANFVEDGSYTREIMANEFKQLMIARPDEICVLVGYDDNKIVGHLIAFRPYNRDYIVLDQAWNIATPEHNLEGFECLKNWVKSIGLKEIRFETEKDSVALRAAKIWGFESHSIVMSMRL